MATMKWMWQSDDGTLHEDRHAAERHDLEQYLFSLLPVEISHTDMAAWLADNLEMLKELYYSGIPKKAEESSVVVDATGEAV